ncbi:hypothetical protein [Spirosoma lituiforme]
MLVATNPYLTKAYLQGGSPFLYAFPFIAFQFYCIATLHRLLGQMFEKLCLISKDSVGFGSYQ